jgi:hypothetical protein
MVRFSVMVIVSIKPRARVRVGVWVKVSVNVIARPRAIDWFRFRLGLFFVLDFGLD